MFGPEMVVPFRKKERKKEIDVLMEPIKWFNNSVNSQTN